ncbi:MAG: AmmeMemoRadiSam system radical SAM enzyme [Magnetococcales bacterium]|nr:AmmeMemoRadiSam system radical SAM enzyme [Magnetococcales bacterium]
MKARYWHFSKDGRIQCDLCPHHCQLAEEQRGLCFVRARQGGEIVLTTYGRSSGFCVDPIEKKPLSHFLPGTSTLSFGTAGCNLTCKFCQNWHMSKSKRTDSLSESATPEQIAQGAQRNHCASVSYTYNDPVIFLEYAVDTSIACRERGVRSVAVTAGYIDPEPAEKFFSHMDAANVDLKAFSEKFYRKLTGGHLQPVLDVLQYIKHETSVWLEITTLLIPGENDSEGELQALTQWVAEHLGPDVPIHFTAFHPDWKLNHLPRTPSHTLTRARNIALQNGLRYPLTGNVHDPQGATTWCHHCQKPLVERVGWQIRGWHLTDQGACRHCATPCAGIFEGAPGDWGARRHPVRLS